MLKKQYSQLLKNKLFNQIDLNKQVQLVAGIKQRSRPNRIQVNDQGILVGTSLKLPKDLKQHVQKLKSKKILIINFLINIMGNDLGNKLL